MILFSSAIIYIRTYCIVSNKCPGGVAIFQKGDVYKRQVFNAKMQWLSLFTMTRRREILAFYLVLFENNLGGRLLEGERLLETIRYAILTYNFQIKMGQANPTHRMGNFNEQPVLLSG